METRYLRYEDYAGHKHRIEIRSEEHLTELKALLGETGEMYEIYTPAKLAPLGEVIARRSPCPVADVGNLEGLVVEAVSKVELLGVLVHVLEVQEAERLEAIRVRQARKAHPQMIVAAIRRGEHTWVRLHQFFPESEWKELASTLSTLQRKELIHLDAHLTFRLGARKGRY